MSQWPFMQTFVSFLVGISVLVSSARADDDSTGRLEFVGMVTDEELDMTTSVEVSRDGRFLYASAWQAATVTVWERDSDTGELTKIQAINDAENLNGATALRLSPDESCAVASSFRSQTAVLYGRDAETGKLTRLDVANNEVDGVTGLSWAIDVAFSPDGQFVYVIDSRGPTNRLGLGVAAGSVTAFRINEGKELEFVEAGQDSSFADVRGIAITPDGSQIVLTSSSAATLVVLGRHETTGKTHNQQVIEDEKGGVHGLSGAMAVCVSEDGRFVYVSSGRFRGDNCVSVYQFGDSGNLSLVQEIMNDEDELKGFVGGNEITISPDGRHVYAVASRSNALACFARDIETGVLTFLETIPNEQDRLTAAAGLCVSPDGKYVYVAAEGSSTISIYRRK